MKTGRLAIFIFIFGLALPGFGQKASKRDISTYDDGGTANFSFQFFQDHKIRSERLRGFIWSHFSEKRLGHIKAALYSYHGDPTYHHIFIEPNAKGTWQVAIEYENYCCWTDRIAKPRKQEKVRRWSAVYQAVERRTKSSIKAAPGPRCTSVLQDDLGATHAGEYELILRETVETGMVRCL